MVGDKQSPSATAGGCVDNYDDDGRDSILEVDLDVVK